jgi:hypothetical protein
LERAGRAAKDVEQVFEKALVSGIQAAEDFASIYLAYVDFQRRAIKMSKGINFAV